MQRKILKEVLFLSLSACTLGGLPAAAAGLLTPGTPYTGSSITNTSNAPLIDGSGTYSIVNGSGNTLTVTGSGSTGLFSLDNGETATLTGNIDWNASNTGINYQTSEVNNSNLTVNGNTKLTVDNTDSSVYINEIFRFGDKTTDNTTTATFNGDLSITANADNVSSSQTLLSAWGTNTTVDINGNLNLNNTVSGSSGMANALYAGNDSATASGPTVTVNGDLAHIQAISANDPKAITAGDMSTIDINAKTLQVIGNISFLGHASNSNITLYPGGTVKATFDGANSYWYGDEENYTDLCSLFGGKPGTLDLTFENGAEWIYFGDTHTKTAYGLTIDLAQPKYISSLTLENGGIVNLQDADIQKKLAAISGLTDIYTKLKSINHDYVTIGDLKGSNGIFKLDMNVNDKSQSDMIFVNSSTQPGEHYINANLTEADLHSLSATNTLRFATTAAAASGVTFGTSQAYSGNLWTYHALVGSSAYSASDSENALYNTRLLSTDGSINGTSSLSDVDDTYAGGTNWFLYGITKTPSGFADGLIKAADSAYDFALDMDDLNKRQGEKQYLEDSSSGNQGFWVRMQRTSREIEDVVSGTTDMYQVGYDKLRENGHQRIGIALDYKKNSGGFLDTEGTMNNSRREISLYDTFRFDKNDSYLDLVLRYGRMNHDFWLLGSDDSRVTGGYDNYALLLSTEYGAKKTFGNHNFFEPQIQLQLGHLGSDSYMTSNDTRVSMNSVNRLMGRVGFRIGHESRKGTVYVRADAIHEFNNGGQEITLSDQYGSLSSETVKRGSWYNVGIGGNYAFGGTFSAYASVEKTFGNELRGWEFDIGTRWSF